MARLDVRVIPEGWWYRLELYHAGDHIGEYERSMVRGERAQHEAEAKGREALRASDRLLAAHRLHGKIAVRWNRKEGRKEIRTYQENEKDPGSGGTVVDLIPSGLWRNRRSR